VWSLSQSSGISGACSSAWAMMAAILTEGPGENRGVICVVVPIKAFTSAKTRLSARFDADQRACLAQASAERVLFAVASCAAVDRRIAVVETGAAAKMARHHGFDVIQRTDIYGQSAAVGATSRFILDLRCLWES